MRINGFTKKNRIAKRRKTKARQLRAVLSAGLTALAWVMPALLAGMLILWLHHADFMRVAAIRVSGCSMLPQERILKQIGIRAGDNILSCDPRELSERLEQDPWIYSAVIKRRLPDTLDVSIEERRAVAVINLDGLYFVDERGHIFTEAPEDGAGLPLLTGLTRDDVSAGGGDAGRLIDEAVSLIACMSGRELFGAVPPEIRMDAVFGLTVADKEGSEEIYMGFDEYAGKLELLRRVRSDLAQKGLAARFIHVGSAARAYVTPEPRVKNNIPPRDRVGKKEIKRTVS